MRMAPYPGRFPALFEYVDVATWVPNFQPFRNTPLGRFFIDTLREVSDRMFDLMNNRSDPAMDPSLYLGNDDDHDKDNEDDDKDYGGSEKSSDAENRDEEREGGPIGEIGDGVPMSSSSGIRVTIKKPSNILNVPAVGFYRIFCSFCDS